MFAQLYMENIYLNTLPEPTNDMKENYDNGKKDDTETEYCVNR